MQFGSKKLRSVEDYPAENMFNCPSIIARTYPSAASVELKTMTQLGPCMALIEWLTPSKYILNARAGDGTALSFYFNAHAKSGVKHRLTK